MKKLFLIILFVVPMSLLAQENKATLQREARKLAREGNELFSQNNFTDAEVAYKKALEKDPNYDIANYNLGVALSEQNRDKEAVAQYEITAKMSEDKATKSEAYHNIGNQHYDTKNYQGAVDAYKNSLRSNPNDDETRYNLALAQDMLEDQQNKDNKDEKDNKDDKKDQDKNDQDKDKKDQEDKDKKDDGKDEKNKDENEGDQDDKKKDPKDENQDKENKDQQQKPQPGKLSPQQVEQLLEAMNNEEKKTQEKMNARKEKGVKIKQEKDW
jgi:Ca-activated chloride channel family protein